MLKFHNYCFDDMFNSCNKVNFNLQSEIFVFFYNGIAIIDIANVIC